MEKRKEKRNFKFPRVNKFDLSNPHVNYKNYLLNVATQKARPESIFLYGPSLNHLIIC
jgi:hypothetical protein